MLTPLQSAARALAVELRFGRDRLPAELREAIAQGPAYPQQEFTPG